MVIKMLTFLFRFISSGLLVALLALNVLTLTSQVVFDSLSNTVGKYASMIGHPELMDGSPSKNNKANRESLQKRNQTLVKDKRLLSQEKAILERKLAANKQSLADLKKRNQTLTTEKRLLAQEKAGLQTKLDTNRQSVKQITERISARTLRNVSANAGSALGEAIPYVGITVVAATVAMDIYDGCKTMEDMNELAALFEQTTAELEWQQNETCGQKAPTVDDLTAGIKSIGESFEATYSKAVKGISHWSSETGEAVVGVSVFAIEDIKEKSRNFRQALGGTIAEVVSRWKPKPPANTNKPPKRRLDKIRDHLSQVTFPFWAKVMSW